MKLEVNDTGPSTILFDIRDLKVDLQDHVYPESDQKTNEPITGEFLIPQVVPVKISNSDIVKEEFDPFIPVKVDLFDHQGDLGAFDIIDLPEQQDLVLGTNLMGVTKTVEIDPSVDPRSKLLVVLAIPNDTNLQELPDFVRFKINLKSYTNSEIGTGQGFEVQQFSGTADGVIVGSADIRGDAKAFLHSLEEMSAFSSSATQIILKTTGMDVAGFEY